MEVVAIVLEEAMTDVEAEVEEVDEMIMVDEVNMVCYFPID